MSNELSKYQRKCKLCGKDITHLHGNTKHCKEPKPKFGGKSCSDVARRQKLHDNYMERTSRSPLSNNHRILKSLFPTGIKKSGILSLSFLENLGFQKEGVSPKRQDLKHQFGDHIINFRVYINEESDKVLIWGSGMDYREALRELIITR